MLQTPQDEATQPAPVDSPLDRVLEAFEANSPGELLAILPRAYHVLGAAPGEVEEGTPVTLLGRILGEYTQTPHDKLGSVRTQLAIPGQRIGLSWVSSRSRLKALFYAISNRYPPGTPVLVSGKVRRFGAHGVSIDNPDIERPPAHVMARRTPGQTLVLPVYRLPRKLRQDQVRGAVQEAFEHVSAGTLPAGIEQACALPGLVESLEMVHGLRPLDAGAAGALLEGRSPWHRRIQVERLWEVMRELPQLVTNPPPGQRIEADVGDLRARLPFTLTGEQSGVLEEVMSDLRSGDRGMRRLLQGDVGSGKSVVAYLASVAVARAGFPAALTAPTDILASQLHEGIAEIAADCKVPVHYISSRSRAAERRRVEKFCRSGKPGIVVGTHLVSSLPFQRLGLLVIDEEQRFGVGVKERLGVHQPHVLAMSATPVPRSLARVLYTGQEVSIIRQRPSGRKPVKTRLFEGREAKSRLLEFMAREFEAGRQAFVVCPSIGSREMTSVNQVAGGLARRFGPDRVRSIHGEMPDAEVAKVLEAFRAGAFPCLVATTIVEVGINVPNASIMVVTDPQRLGTSQLHQIRGRVGRGAHPGYCALVPGSGLSGEARERLEFLAGCNDGFELAEYDLTQRGAGDLGGMRQSGFLEVDIIALQREAQLIHDHLRGEAHSQRASAREGAWDFGDLTF